MPPVPPVPPSPPELSQRITGLNDRFRRAPFHEKDWTKLADAGLLVHVFDGWENHDSLWLARCEDDKNFGCDLSTSLIHRGQHKSDEWGDKYTVDECSGDKGRSTCRFPMFLDSNAPGPYAGTGVILRPGATPLLCGKGMDSGGHCGNRWCPEIAPSETVTPDWLEKQHWDIPGTGCRDAWKPQGNSFGAYLQRQAAYQIRWNRMEHNEIIVGGGSWNGNLPHIIDAFFVRKGMGADGVRKQHRRFLDEYGLTARDCPLVEMDDFNWEEPLTQI